MAENAGAVPPTTAGWPPIGPTAPLDQTAATPRTPQSLEHDALPLPAPPGSGEVVDVPSPQQVRVSLRRYRQASDAELAARLPSSSAYEALAIRHVLRERELAGGALAANGRPLKMTAGGSPSVLDGLSKLPAAEARDELRRLVQDADPEVRLKALTLLATSGDPQLDDIVRRRAVEDGDPRVAELATRIMRGEVR